MQSQISDLRDKLTDACLGTLEGSEEHASFVEFLGLIRSAHRDHGDCA